jgi:hypothetical protein
LVAVALSLAGVFDSIGTVLRQILSRRTGPTGVCPGSAGSRSTHSSAAGRSHGGALCPSALQKIGRCTAAAARGVGYSRPAPSARDIEKVIQLPSSGTASRSAIGSAGSSSGALT